MSDRNHLHQENNQHIEPGQYRLNGEVVGNQKSANGDQQRTQQPPQQSTKGKSVIPGHVEGIGGWLVVMALVLAFNCLLGLYRVFGSLEMVLELNTYLTAGVMGVDLVTAIILEFLTDVLQVVVFAIGLILLLIKHPMFPKFFLWSMIGVFVACIIMMLLTMGLAQDYPEIDISIYEQAVMGHLRFSIIWCSYVYRSKRVKNTYVSSSVN